MRKAGWDVWLAWDFEGTYEEGPQPIIDSAKRDRRWCQGNLQHTWLLFARGLNRANKVHLFMGIMGYLASPLWLAFLIVGTLVIYQHKASGLSVIPVDGLFSRWFPDLDCAPRASPSSSAPWACCSRPSSSPSCRPFSAAISAAASAACSPSRSGCCWKPFPPRSSRRCS